MNHEDYLAIKDPDTALAVRLAVTMGWKVELHGVFEIVQVYDSNDNGYQGRYFNPFTDASIPYGLIGHGVARVTSDFLMFHARAGWTHVANLSKTHAIINAYCQEDPMGHWAKFIGEK